MNSQRLRLVVAGIGLAFCTLVYADNRAYVWTYEYKTMKAGEAEVEYYTTFHSPFSESISGTVTAEHNLELEVGMNDRFDMGFYQVFVQPPEGALTYKGFKVRARYRFGESGQYPIDPLLYVEYKGQPDFSGPEWEVKLILAKDFNRLNVAVNPVLEFVSDGKGWEREIKYNLGISYRLYRLVGFGLEARGGAHGHYLGPVISHGKDDLWVALGSAFAITSIPSGKPKFMLRLIVGIGLRP